MSEYSVLGFDETTGFNSVENKRKTKVYKPAASPCNGCVCSWACAGCQRKGGKPDEGKALACTTFLRSIGRKVVKPNKLPLRDLYLVAFE